MKGHAKIKSHMHKAEKHAEKSRMHLEQAHGLMGSMNEEKKPKAAKKGKKPVPKKKK